MTNWQFYISMSISPCKEDESTAKCKCQYEIVKEKSKNLSEFAERPQ